MSRQIVRSRPLVGAALMVAWLGLVPGTALADDELTPDQERSGATATVAPKARPFTPGAPGIGDPYYPQDGNGGYDVQHYGLDLGYTPATDVLTGRATITARATQNLSRFNLDLVGLDVSSITVNGRRAAWARTGHELTVFPTRGLGKRKEFTTVVTYHGVPQTIADSEIGSSGFIHTDDGALVAGQPHGAATWFPVNDHPLDKASYTFRVTAPAGLQVVANGLLTQKKTHRGLTTWRWNAEEPMASYLATVDIGHFTTKRYTRGGISYVDSIDPDLFKATGPRTGSQYALSQIGNPAYKRLARTFSVPSTGGKVSFWVNRDTEPDWDFLFVEAHTVGVDDWTTLPDQNGHTSTSTGTFCPSSLIDHPFLAHYKTASGEETCTPTGTTGSWNAASGTSDGYEQWTVDLAPYAGKRVELSISYASDPFVQGDGVFVDDIDVPFGPGSTSFEADGNPLDGWRVLGAPAGSEQNPNDWIVGTLADAPSIGKNAAAALDREPEILSFLSGLFGPYPFTAAGGIVDDAPLDFALETQTRPVYSFGFFISPGEDSVVVHENAHQWTGDNLALKRWRDIWLNEGFASYTEWLWAEDQGRATAQQIFDSLGTIPADDAFWALRIGDPGSDHQFDGPIYDRGAATLHALRLLVGDDTFFRILKRWTSAHAGGNVTTAQFIALAERLSGRDLDAFFTEWLYTPSKPASLSAAQLTAKSAGTSSQLRSRRGADDLASIHARFGLMPLREH